MSKHKVGYTKGIGVLHKNLETFEKKEEKKSTSASIVTPKHKVCHSGTKCILVPKKRIWPNIRRTEICRSFVGTHNLCVLTILTWIHANMYTIQIVCMHTSAQKRPFWWAKKGLQKKVLLQIRIRDMDTSNIYETQIAHINHQPPHNFSLQHEVRKPPLPNPSFPYENMYTIQIVCMHASAQKRPKKVFFWEKKSSFANTNTM